MSKYSNAPEVIWLRKIWEQLQVLTSATISGGGSSASNYEYLVDFIVDGGGGAPTNGETEYANPDVTGDIKVYKNGVGYLTTGTDYDQIVGGGIELLDGAVFTTGEKYTIFKVITE